MLGVTSATGSTTVYNMNSNRERLYAENILLRNEWYSTLAASIRDQVLNLGVIKTAEQGVEIIQQDTLGPGICAVSEGQVAITRRLPGDATFFYYLGGPGFWFGEVGVLTETAAVITATARTRVRYLLLPIAIFNKAAAERPELYRVVADMALKRSLEVYRAMAEAHILMPGERLQQRLIAMARLLHLDDQKADMLDLQLSQQEVAQMLGCSRPTVNTILSDLQKKGLIEVSFRKISIVDLPGLVKAAAPADGDSP